MSKTVNRDVLELLVRNSHRIGECWCGGWDLNPRRPMPSGPQPDPFDLARAPPHSFLIPDLVFSILVAGFIRC